MYDGLHQAYVFVICDRFITETAELNWIKKSTLLQLKSRLIIPDINSELQQCYQVSDSDLHKLLLSPRARVEKIGEYLCCSQCERALKNDKMDKNPPKYAIANNFAIGALPQQLTGLLIGALNFHVSTLRTNNVYVLMSGNFTPNQRHIVRTRCNIDVGNHSIYSWLRANNPIFAKMDPLQIFLLQLFWKMIQVLRKNLKTQLWKILLTFNIGFLIMGILHVLTSPLQPIQKQQVQRLRELSGHCAMPMVRSTTLSNMT